MTRSHLRAASGSEGRGWGLGKSRERNVRFREVGLMEQQEQRLAWSHRQAGWWGCGGGWKGWCELGRG